MTVAEHPEPQYCLPSSTGHLAEVRTEMGDEFKARPTVVVADDHPRALAATSQLMRQEYDVVAAVHDGLGAVEAVARLNPDVVILDIAMPGTDGFEAARRIRALAIPTRIVFLTITEDWDYVLTASELGASYVLKRRIYTDLISAVNETLAGRLFLSPIAAANSGNYGASRP